MERRSEMTKALLGESFKELMLKKSFDKITVRMITDAAGVIRPTFYNYFKDKYEVMEWLLFQDIFSDALEFIKRDEIQEALKLIFKRIESQKQYYVRAFEVKGQNSFDGMLAGGIYTMLQQVLESHALDLKGFSKSISQDVFLKYHSITMMNGIRWWVTDKEISIGADEALKAYEFLITHSFTELINI